MFTRKKKGEPEAEAKDVEVEEREEREFPPTEDAPQAEVPAEPVKYCNRNSNRK